MPERWRFTDAGGGEHEVALQAATVAPEPAVAQMLVAAGLGIVRLPDFLAGSAIAEDRFVRLLPEYRTESVDVHAVYPAHRSLSAKVRVFIDALTRGAGQAGTDAV